MTIRARGTENRAKYNNRASDITGANATGYTTSWRSPNPSRKPFRLPPLSRRSPAAITRRSPAANRCLQAPAAGTALRTGGFTSIRHHLAFSSISWVNPSSCIGQRNESADTVAVLVGLVASFVLGAKTSRVSFFPRRCLFVRVDCSVRVWCPCKSP
jgi:hypothetical protein